MIFGTPLFWRETHKPGKFLIFEGRVVIVLLLMVMHIRPWTITLALSVMGILWYFDQKGVSADSILRYLRARLVGRKRSAQGVHAQRVATDFHFEPDAFRKQSKLTAARLSLQKGATEKAVKKTGKPLFGLPLPGLNRSSEKGGGDA